MAMLDAWGMSSEEILKTFPFPPLVRREAQQAGVLSTDALPPGPPQEGQSAARREQNQKLREFYQERGYRRQQELVGQLLAHKLLQAVYSQRQLEGGAHRLLVQPLQRVDDRQPESSPSPVL